MKRYIWIFVVIVLFGCNKSTDDCNGSVEHPVGLSVLPLAKLDKNPKKFGSCDELKKFLADQVTIYSSSVPRCGALVPEAMNASDPTRQEKGVDEIDRLVQNDSRLFFARYQKIEVFNKLSKALESSISVPQVLTLQLALYRTKLLVFGTLQNQTLLRIYELSSEAPPALVSESRYAGRLQDARLSGSKLRMVTENWNSASEFVSGEYHGVPCDQVHYPSFDIDAYGMTTVHSIDLEKKTQQSVGLLGSYRNLYASDQNLYLMSSYPVVTGGVDTAIRKISGLDVINGGTSGLVLNRWSVKEKDRHFLMAVQDINSTSTRLRIFNEKLGERSQSESFGPGEQLQAVRYINDKAYVVTFRNIDPLHVIDLKDLSQPKLVGELLVPGFSSFLMPIDEGKLFGLGFVPVMGRQFALQASVFDISQDPKVISQKEVGEPGSYSMATWDSHALAYDPKTQEVGLPYFDWRTSGARVFELKKDFNLVLDVTHVDLLPKRCSEILKRNSSYATTLDIQRLVRWDQNWVSVSAFGLRIHSKNKTSTFPFEGAAEECGRVMPGSI